MGMKLFDGDTDVSGEDISKIQINDEYARRFEHNKKREALQRYEELKAKGLVAASDEESDSESSSENEDVNRIVSSKKNLEFFDAIIKVRNHDPSLKQKDVKLFESDDDDDDDDESSDREEENEVGGGEGEKKSRKKGAYLKDVIAKQLIEDGPEFEDQDPDEKEKANNRKSYLEEQEEYKKAFLEAAQTIEDCGDEGFIKVKEKQDKDEQGKMDTDDEEFTKKVDEFFGWDSEDKNQKFLRDYFVNRLWEDKKKDGDGGLADDDLDELYKDEEEIEKQEGYELEYNFRHEENAGDRVLVFPRSVEGSVRKKESKRKEERRRKEEREHLKRLEIEEDVKHLKNVKRQEVREKMKKVLEIAGIKEAEESPFSAKDLEDEFDPAEYDRLMKTVFDDKYYNAEDDGLASDEEEIEKPDFDKEDELLGLPKGWDVVQSGDGFSAARERSLKRKLESCNGNSEAEEVNGESEKELKGSDEVETEEGKRKRKRKMSLVKRVEQEMLDELYKLDYEDTIGDLKTRFKYAKIKPNRYGLDTADILMLDDKELNQYVSVKKLAPYSDKEWKVPRNKVSGIKKKVWDVYQNDRRSRKKRIVNDPSSSSKVEGKGDLGAEDTFEGNGDHEGQATESKRKKRRKQLKITGQRKDAYGLTHKPKKGKKKN